MTGYVEYGWVKAIQSSVLSNFRYFHSLPEFGCVYFLTENDLPLGNSLQVSGRTFSSSCTEQCRGFGAIWGCFDFCFIRLHTRTQKESSPIVWCYTAGIQWHLPKSAFPCGGLRLTRTDQGMRWYVPVEWSSSHFRHSYCQELDNVKTLVQPVVISLTTFPFLVRRQIGAFPSFVYLRWEQMVHFPLSQLLWKVF